mmetsp:Transcript_11992/g.28854  ORF Transcript_11992/g.28854 Transcript_11992/m.28854 type:complete len:498 (-) Transcript_11992:61-1554(-)
MTMTTTKMPVLLAFLVLIATAATVFHDETTILDVHGFTVPSPSLFDSYNGRRTVERSVISSSSGSIMSIQSPQTRLILGLAAEDYLEDLSKESEDDGSKKSNATATESSSNEYLDDSSLKDPETYLDDLSARSSPTSSSSSSKVNGLSNDYLDDSSLKEPETYLDDLSSSSSSSIKDGAKSRDEASPKYLEDLSSSTWNYTPTTPSKEDDEKSSATPTADGEVSASVALSSLLQLGAATGRGEFATADQKEKAANYISVLEHNNPTSDATKSSKMLGRWTLVYSSSQLFRSSPFFMAGRAVCTTPDQAKQYDWFCDMHRKALAISTIGQVRQVVSETRLTSEFEVQVGSVPFLSDFTPFAYSGGWPVSIDGSIVSSADITPTDDGSGWEIFMDTVEIKGSNIPLLRQVLDNGLMLASRQLGSFLEENIDSYTNPKPIFDTTYLSDTIRISRDQDGKVFVYAKESHDTTPTEYSDSDSDLGFLKLLEGFNDAVVKFYI